MREIRKYKTSNGANNPRPPVGCPLEAVYELCLFVTHVVLSHEDEPYGLISHSKYTNPTAMADTTTRCMNILLELMVVTYPTPETSVLTRGTVRWGFWQLISRFWTSAMQGLAMWGFETHGAS